MKKSLFGKLTTLLLLAFMVGFAGCNNEDIDPSVATIVVEGVDANGVLNVAYTGSTDASFKIKANRKWEIFFEGDVGDPAWITVTPMKGTGNKEIKLSLHPNAGQAREVKLKIVSVVASANVLVKQAGDPSVLPDLELLRVQFGTGGATASPYPYLDQYEGDLQISGEGVTKDGAGVVIEPTLTGAGVSIRGNSSSKSYPDASGGNNLFFGATAHLLTGKVMTKGYTAFKATFGLNYYKYGAVDAKFDPSLLDLMIGATESELVKVAYSYTTEYDDNWGYVVSTTFVLPTASESIYIKLVANEASVIRVDDLVIKGTDKGEPVGTHISATTATDITETEATIGGSYTLDKGKTATEVGVEYKRGAEAYVAQAAAAVATPFTVALTGLTADTEYTYRAYMIVDGGKVYSSEMTFRTAGGAVGGMIYFENVGEKVEKVGNAWPFVDAFTGWGRQGSLDQSAVTYTGFSASVRNSGTNYEPTDASASGAPYVFLGTATAPAVQKFEINNINVTGVTNFTFTTMALFQESFGAGPVFGAITSTSFKMHGSLNGTDWTDLTFSVVAGTMWSKVSAEFKVPSGTPKLFLRISEPSLASAYRFDDFTLTEGGSGTIVIGGGTVPSETKVTTTAATAITETEATVGGSYTLATGKTATEVGVEYKKGTDAYVAQAAAAVATPFTVALTGLTADTEYTYRGYVTVDGGKVYSAEATFRTQAGGVVPAGAIYYEKVGTTVEKVGNAWPFVDAFTGWGRQGSLDQSAVTYTGFSASVRNSGTNYEPTDASATGAPYVFLGTATAPAVQKFEINNINVTGVTNFTFTTTALFQESFGTGPVFGTITSTSFKMQGSLNGTEWTDLQFSVGAGTMWSKVTAEFKVPSGTTKLFLKIFEPSVASAYRFDDFTLTEGGSGTIVIGSGGTVPVETKVTTTAATAITETGATVGGSYTLATGKTATEVGVEYKKGAEAYVAQAAAAVATPFTVALAGLTADTEYTYRAYITVDGGKVYSTEATFRTKAASVGTWDVEESFEAGYNSAGSYSTGSFVGTSGVTWNYVKGRTDTKVNERTSIMMGRNQTPQSQIETSAISGGIGDLEFTYMQAFDNTVDLEVYVNGDLKGSYAESVKEVPVVVKIEGINAENAVIKFISRIKGGGQVCINDVKWTNKK